jgi:hypothetical protein
MMGWPMETVRELLKQLLLTTISWVDFTSTEDSELYHYRARALDLSLQRLKECVILLIYLPINDVNVIV